MSADIPNPREVIQLLDVLECTSNFHKLSEEFRLRFPDPKEYFKVREMFQFSLSLLGNVVNI